MADVRLPLHAIKGRGAASAIAHRFSSDARADFDDGWGTLEEAVQTADGEEAARPATQVRFEDAKSVITRNSSPDIYFDYGLNPYRGCEHGCIYCYARPSHSYLNLSPGLDFETRLIAKRNLVEVLGCELASPRYLPRMIAIGTVTDGYQPIERELRLTRGAVELLQRCQHPLAIVTKGSGVERDLDLLAPMAAQHLAAVYMTITTLDADLARKLEPRAAAPHRRLRTIRTLAEAGIPVGVSVAPQIPFVNDDMEQVLAAAYEAGARSAFYTVLRLPWELAPLFREWLSLHYPQRAERIMARVQDLHDLSDAQRANGKDYAADFASRMKGKGLWADLIRQRFEKTCAKLGLNRQRSETDLSRFRPAALHGQDSLF
ncbi:PA0069 family radical SAM protein [Variovorax sp. HJSM1_2]|uniref:PA0069 family radical SAM protein n=1 Tax=Variovorax sp. HJSM1_2 TaxID=3366263 RepID=UPI003BC20D8A